ncbi:MAG: PQQ-dependent sugar dehydrogenase [Candidatus Sericytochromatia bacterium]
MLGLRRSAALLTAAALIAGGCGTSRDEAPTTAAAPAQNPAGLVAVTVRVDPALAQAPFHVPRQALVPPGWTMSLWARVPKARLAAWTPDGALLVSVPAEGNVLKLTPGNPQRRQVLLDGLNAPHGLAFAGSTLYVAESNQVDAYTYADGAATGRRVVAPGLPDNSSPELHGAYMHALKSVAVGADGAVYFSIGSTGNISAEDRSATPERATIMRIPPQGGPYRVFARGVRNGTGLAVAPDGWVWTAVNNRDNIADPRGRVVQAYVDDHPPESFARLTPGRDLGWPYCNPDGTGGSVPLVRDVQTNPDGAELDCSALPPVEQTLGAHSAPLGVSFVSGGLPAPYSEGALVGVHGSWNRQSPRAPEVSFFPWRNGTLGDQQTLVGGFQAPDGSRWGRPVAAVVGPDGAVYVTDDDAGAVYRAAPPGR